MVFLEVEGVGVVLAFAFFLLKGVWGCWIRPAKRFQSVAAIFLMIKKSRRAKDSDETSRRSTISESEKVGICAKSMCIRLRLQFVMPFSERRPQHISVSSTKKSIWYAKRIVHR